MSTFQKATKKQARARVALIGPSGSGKTYSALAVATALGGKVAVIDTEHGSASKYAGDPFDFDVLELASYSPEVYVEALAAAEAEGYDVVVIDSLSHAWMGKDGSLEQKDRASARHGENNWTAWREVTPKHNALIEAMLQCRCHLIATMRAKTEYVVERVDGRSVPRKVGLAPVQRDGIEYEFDVVGDLNHNHDFVVSKTRCAALDGQVIQKPGAQLAASLDEWLSDGEEPPPPASAELVEQIKELVAELFPAGEEQLWARLESGYGQRDPSRLTEEQALEVIKKLLEAKDAKAAEAAAAGLEGSDEGTA